MRIFRMRSDLWWSLVLTGLLVTLISWLATMVLGKIDFTIKPMDDGTVGSVATVETPRVNSIKEIMEQNGGYFTIETSRFKTTEFAHGYESCIVITLPSSERVLAKVDSYSSQTIGDIRVFPIGMVSSTPPKRVDSAQEMKIELTDDSFYIDMGKEKTSMKYLLAPTEEGTLLTVQLVSIIPSWLLVRFIGVKIGVFPPIFAKKDKRKKEDNI